MRQQKLLRLLREMLKDSKRSDREIAKNIGVSQPTVTRTRAQLEKEYIKTYTVIPDFMKLGYQILAFTFLKMKSYPSKKDADEVFSKAKEWTNKHSNIIFAADGEGFGRDIVMMSFHKDYPSYSDFTRTVALECSETLSELSSFLVSIGTGYEIKPFDLRYLADDV
ncbi:MAG: AsnC family transcriptional regulator [Candidatus Bathyarchaeia archaeon]